METIKPALEGLLYIVGEDGLSLEQASEALECTVVEVQEVLQQLKEEYDNDDHGLQVVNYGGLYRFVTKEKVNEAATRLFAMNKTASLSQSALETLAIIAYKQPVTRVEIEEIRGVSCDNMIRKLLGRNLIKEAGRADAPGKPFLYEVTQDFLDAFKLVSLSELPDLPSYASDTNEVLFD